MRMINKIIDFYKNNVDVNELFHFFLNEYDKIFREIGYKFTAYDFDKIKIYFWFYTVPVYEITTIATMPNLDRKKIAFLHFLSCLQCRYIDNIIDGDVNGVNLQRSVKISFALFKYIIGKNEIITMKLFSFYLDSWLKYENRKDKKKLSNIEQRVSLLFLIPDYIISFLPNEKNVKNFYISYVNYIKIMLLYHDYCDFDKDIKHNSQIHQVVEERLSFDKKKYAEQTVQSISKYYSKIKSQTFFFTHFKSTLYPTLINSIGY